MRRCILFFHGKNGQAIPRPLGDIGVDTLSAAVDVMRSHPSMPAHADLAGTWCCSFAEIEGEHDGKDLDVHRPAATSEDDPSPIHPPSCQYRFTLSARGAISNASVVQ